MRIKALAALHKRVIHGNGRSFSEFDLELEEKWIKAYPYGSLESVCSDCFAAPAVAGDVPVPSRRK